MNTRAMGLVALLLLAVPAAAHRLDEYLQATLVSLDNGQIRASMRLIPGVAVSEGVIAAIDSNHDGYFADAEQKSYAQAVLRDLSVTSDGHALTPLLVSASCPSAAAIRAGLGEIDIEFVARLPAGGSRRTLILENHHSPAMSVYLMNSLVPRDPGIRITTQTRNKSQSFYRIDYAQAGNSWFSQWKSRLFLIVLLLPAAMPPS